MVNFQAHVDNHLPYAPKVCPLFQCPVQRPREEEEKAEARKEGKRITSIGGE